MVKRLIAAKYRRVRSRLGSQPNIFSGAGRKASPQAAADIKPANGYLKVSVYGASFANRHLRAGLR